MSRKYLDIFLRESREQLKLLQQGLLALEGDPDNTKLVHELQRHAHTVKGSARMLGFDGISSIAHAMEDCFKEIESGAADLDDTCASRLLKGCDAIARLTSALAADEPPPFDVEQFLDSFMSEESLDHQLPNLLHDPLHDHTVRVKVETLDRMINLAGEMFICRQQLEDRLESVRSITREAGSFAWHSTLKLVERDLEDDLQQLQNLIQLSHGEALSLRMLPLHSITDVYQRNVRDLAKSVGKQVKLEIRGGHIELDRRVLDALKPALLHIINNAVVHGIEPPEHRRAIGKPEHGTIRISAFHRGDHARITIRDDGRGLEPGLIRRKAVEQGILDADSATALSNDEALYLALQQGFSTTDTVTDLAGRGVGLDVVSTVLERMKGDIALSSEPDRFFEIALKIPLTLSLIQALIVKCSGEEFAVPVSYVEEIVKIRESDICIEHGETGFSLHGCFIRLFSLPTLLGLQLSPLAPGEVKLSVIVLRLKGERAAFSVDATLRDEAIVVKSFGQQLVRAEFFQGATILGQGYPVLILDVNDLFAAVSSRVSPSLREFPQLKPVSRHKGSILVVDDSITSRTIEQSILATNGYQVETADSGENALLKLAAGSYDLMVSDIEMPGMSGLELVKRVLATPGHRHLPVVMVSSLCSSEDRRLVFESGAKAYMPKGEFDQGLFLSLVHDLINPD